MQRTYSRPIRCANKPISDAYASNLYDQRLLNVPVIRTLGNIRRNFPPKQHKRHGTEWITFDLSILYALWVKRYNAMYEDINDDL